MLGFITQAEFDAEHELRLKAEAREEALREQINALTQLLRDERVRQSDLLDRFQPKPVVANPQAFVGAGNGHMTYEEIMATPAWGKRGMRERLNWADAALRRKEQEARQKTLESRQEILTEDEADKIDKSLPG